VHVGPYDGLGDAWSRLMGEWIPANHLHMRRGESYEVYLNNPMNAKPEELKTELCVPVA
jgi:AraC family transcriptional regulator